VAEKTITKMRYSKSKYPVGAAWQGTTSFGKIVTIWLDDRSSFNFEIWKWSAVYDDGSGLIFDWAISYRGCVNSAPAIQGRYRRINPPK
jgi:hypothetical protein